MEKMRLTVWLKDGRKLSGVYTWVGALARLAFARDLDLFEGFFITGV